MTDARGPSFESPSTEPSASSERARTPSALAAPESALRANESRTTSGPYRLVRRFRGVAPGPKSHTVGDDVAVITSADTERSVGWHRRLREAHIPGIRCAHTHQHRGVDDCLKFLLVRSVVVLAFGFSGLAGACSTSEASAESGSANDCQAAWNIVEQIQAQQQTADDDFDEIQTLLEATAEEIDSSTVSAALREINDSIRYMKLGPTPTDGYIASLHIDHAIASLGLACVESSPDLRFE